MKIGGLGGKIKLLVCNGNNERGGFSTSGRPKSSASFNCWMELVELGEERKRMIEEERHLIYMEGDYNGSAVALLGNRLSAREIQEKQT